MKLIVLLIRDDLGIVQMLFEHVRVLCRLAPLKAVEVTILVLNCPCILSLFTGQCNLVKQLVCAKVMETLATSALYGRQR